MCTSRELKYIEWLKKSKSPYVGISIISKTDWTTLMGQY